MRILIVRLSSLGDIVMSMAVLQYLKKSLPNATIDWLVDSRFREVLAHNIHLNAIHTISLRDHKKNWLKYVQEILSIRKKLGSYDLIIDMQGLIKSAVISRILGKNIIGFGKKSAKESLAAYFYKYKTEVGFDEHILKRNLALLHNQLGVDVSFTEVMKKENFLFYKKPHMDFSPYFSKDKRNILVVIGGSWASKIYPKELLAQVIDQLKQNAMILWSNAEEHERAKWIASQTAYAQILPQMSLNDLKALIDQCDLVIGNDTGPCHMAWAMNKPSVTILGCTSITRIPVNVKNLAVTSNVCVNPSKINKEDLSIQTISPLEVVDSANHLLSAN